MISRLDSDDRPSCGLCGKTDNLVKTDCCGVWICDEGHKDVGLSSDLNSCFGNHDHYTLCSYHFTHRHKGAWQSCSACRKSFETEMYVWYGTNNFNFSKLETPPPYEPTKCIDCGCLIVLSSDQYARCADGHRCLDCSDLQAEKRFRRIVEDREKEMTRKKEREASRAANVQFFSRLTPQTGEGRNFFQRFLQDGILPKVWCSRCNDSVMRPEIGTIKGDVIVLEGACLHCGGKVVRHVGPEDQS
jgi:hypothetical protein